MIKIARGKGSTGITELEDVQERQRPFLAELIDSLEINVN